MPGKFFFAGDAVEYVDQCPDDKFLHHIGFGPVFDRRAQCRQYRSDVLFKGIGAFHEYGLVQTFFTAEMERNEADIAPSRFGDGAYVGPCVAVFRKEPQYYDWIMRSDFPEYTKRVVTKLRYPDRNIVF